jgi:hypothetical protein
MFACRNGFGTGGYSESRRLFFSAPEHDDTRKPVSEKSPQLRVSDKSRQ